MDIKVQTRIRNEDFGMVRPVRLCPDGADEEHELLPEFAAQEAASEAYLAYMRAHSQAAIDAALEPIREAAREASNTAFEEYMRTHQ